MKSSALALSTATLPSVSASAYSWAGVRVPVSTGPTPGWCLGLDAAVKESLGSSEERVLGTVRREARGVGTLLKRARIGFIEGAMG